MRPAAAPASCGQGLNGLPDRMGDPGRLLGPTSRGAAAMLAGSVGVRKDEPAWPAETEGDAGVAGVAGAAAAEGAAIGAGVADDKVCCQRIAGVAAVAGAAASHSPAGTRHTLKACFTKVERIGIGMNRNPVEQPACSCNHRTSFPSH